MKILGLTACYCSKAVYCHDNYAKLALHVYMSRLMTKPTKWHVHPAKTQIRLGIPSLDRVFAVRMKKAWVLSYPLSAQRRRWSDWADAQADLSLRWAHSHFVGFVMKRFISRSYRSFHMFFFIFCSADLHISRKTYIIIFSSDIQVHHRKDQLHKHRHAGYVLDMYSDPVPG